MAWVPRVAVLLPPRLGEPYTPGEDVFALPLGALKGLLGCLSTKEAAVLRQVSRDAEVQVASHAWADCETPIYGDLAAWRSCFPRATAARLAPGGRWTPADFIYLSGLHALDMRDCLRTSLEPESLTRLAQIPALHLDGCAVRGVLLPALLHGAAAAAEPLHAAAAQALTRASNVEPADCAALVSALVEHMPSQPAAVSLSSALGEWVVMDPRRARCIHEAGGLDAFIAALRSHPGSERLCIAAAAAFSCLAIVGRPSAAPTMEAAGVPALLADMLRRHLASPDAATAASAALAYLVHDLRDATFLTAPGVLESLVEALCAHPTRLALCGAVTQALRALLAQAPDQAAALTAAGAIDAIAHALCHRGDDARGAGLAVLHKIASPERGCQALAGAAGNVPAVVEAANAATTPHAYVGACLALNLLLKTSNVVPTPLRLTAVRTVVEGMRRLADSGVACDVGCKTLVELVAHCSRVCTSTVVEAGGIPLFLSLIDRHLDSEAASASCCRALALVFCSNGDVEGFEAAGGWDVLLRAMQRHPYDSSVQEFCCNILALLVSPPRDGLSEVTSRPALCAAVVAALARGLLSDTMEFVWGRILDAVVEE